MDISPCFQSLYRIHSTFSTFCSWVNGCLCVRCLMTQQAVLHAGGQCVCACTCQHDEQCCQTLSCLPMMPNQAASNTKTHLCHTSLPLQTRVHAQTCWEQQVIKALWMGRAYFGIQHKSIELFYTHQYLQVCECDLFWALLLFFTKFMYLLFKCFKLSKPFVCHQVYLNIFVCDWLVYSLIVKDLDRSFKDCGFKHQKCSNHNMCFVIINSP